MDKTEMMLQELEGLKNTVSRDYGRRLGDMRGETAAKETTVCPECGADVPAGETTCPECDADLTKSADEGAQEQDARRAVFDQGLARR